MVLGCTWARDLRRQCSANVDLGSDGPANNGDIKTRKKWRGKSKKWHKRGPRRDRAEKRITAAGSYPERSRTSNTWPQNTAQDQQPYQMLQLQR